MFCGGWWGVGCFSIQWVVVFQSSGWLSFNPVDGCLSLQWVVIFCENVILLVVVYLKNTVLWASLVERYLMCCLDLNTKKNEAKTIPILWKGALWKKMS